MAEWPDNRTTERTAGFGVATAGRDVAYDTGLRSYMLSIYNMMAGGVALSGVIAFFFAQSGYAEQMMLNGGILKWVIVLSPLAIVMAMSFGAERMSTATLQLLYWGFAALMGLSLSTIFLVYTGESIALTFAATSVSFLALSIWGYTTKKDLSGMGTFLIMGLVGLLVAMLANIFLQSSTLSLAISAIGVLIFAGLTAYDTQKLKSMYFHLQGSEFIGKSVVMGALTLYLDFINMFQFLLSFLGSRD